MKIALITNLYEPYARGGAEVVVKRTARELVRQGHQVVIITGQPFSGLSSLAPEREEKDGLTVYRYYPPNLFFYANDYKYPALVRFFWHGLDMFNWLSAGRMARILRKEQPDLVISHNLMGLGFLIPRLIRKQGLRHMHILHDIQLAVRSGVLLKGQEESWQIKSLPARLYQRITKILFGSPEVVISPSQYLLDFYTQLGYFPKSRKEVLPNPVDDRFLKVDHHEDETTRFLYVGQIARHKGVVELCEAFATVEHNKARLTLVGDGPDFNAVLPFENRDKRVQTMPRIPNESLPEVLAETDVLVLPTKTYENSPTVVYEALAAAVPVLVSDIGGSAELVTHQETGYVVQPADKQALKQGLEYFLQQNVDERRVMGESGRNKIAPLSSEAYVSRLLSL